MIRTFCLALVGFLFWPTAALAQSLVHVRSVGEGQSCWVLLHPFGASGRFWERRAAIIAAAYNVRVYAPDLPSHGASRIAGQFDYDFAAEQVAQALDGACPDPDVIIGASSGGIVAMKLAARGNGRVVAIGVGWSFSDDNVESLTRDALLPSNGLTQWLTSFAEQGQPQIQALQRHQVDLAGLGTRPLLTGAETQALRGRLLVLQGERDDFFLAQSVQALADNIAETRLVVFPGAGHLEPLAPPHAARAWQLIGAFATTGILPAEGGQ